MDIPSSLKPNLFIVGAGKAGTYALYEYLGQHPDVFMSPQKEPNYFGEDMQFRVPRIALDEYIALFSPGRNKKYRGEASVSYLLSATAAQEIAAFNKNSKIIIMARNPIEIVQARHAQNLLRGVETITDLVEALHAEERRRKGIDIPSCAPVVDWLFYREWGKLATQVERYLAAFERHDVFIGLFDDFQADPSGFYMGLLKFLGLEYVPPRSFDRVNARKRPRSYLLSSVIFGRKPMWQSMLARILLPNRRLRRALIDTIARYNEVPERVRRIPGDLRAQLAEEFATEVKRLEKIIGRDLSAWVRVNELR